ncbi:MAG: 50S ribosomal protein L2 [bacterium]|nr:50S ribosomal protein L2 [bacterium]
MSVIIHKPTSPARRHSSVADFSMLTNKRPERSLVVIKKKRSGRNNQGKITVRHRGGGTRKYYRMVDFSRQTRLDQQARVIALEYDPNRSARLALLEYPDSFKAYMIAPTGILVGDMIIATRGKAEVKAGNRLPLAYIPSGMMVNTIEMNPGGRGIVARSAGVGAKVMSVEGDFAMIKMPSGEIRKFNAQCLATVGEVGNSDHRLIRWGKAGRSRLRGIRPTVRGKVMNPVDHPHGGGEGVNPIGLKHPKTPQGKPALGVRTRRKKKASSKYIITRRK